MPANRMVAIFVLLKASGGAQESVERKGRIKAARREILLVAFMRSRLQFGYAWSKRDTERHSSSRRLYASSPFFSSNSYSSPSISMILW
jgi:hypothetical protein